ITVPARTDREFGLALWLFTFVADPETGRHRAAVASRPHPLIGDRAEHPPGPCSWWPGRAALAAGPPPPAHRRAGLLPLLHPWPGAAGRPGPGRRAALDDRDVSTTVDSYVRTGGMISASVGGWRLCVGPASAGVPAWRAGSALAELGEL